MQQGQVFKLKRRAVDGRPVWAYRYRTDGPRSRRLQRGGFSSERDAAEALERAPEQLRRQKGVGREPVAPRGRPTEATHPSRRSLLRMLGRATDQ